MHGYMSQGFAERTARVVRQYESQYGPNHSTPSDKKSPPSLYSRRGWLLQDIWKGEAASCIYANYNPSVTTIKLDQFGLWDLEPAFTLRLSRNGVQIAQESFNNPTCQQLADAFGCFVTGGNPATTGETGITCLTNTIAGGIIDHGFWLLSFSYPGVVAEVTSSNSVLTRGQAFEASSSPDYPSEVGECFDPFDLEWPLMRGSKIICNYHADRGYGISSSYPKQFVR